MQAISESAVLGCPGLRKVFIIEEVQMFSAAASAAVLKTLEEPPAHVVFVLTTTEPSRIAPGLLSRSQHLLFRPIPPSAAATLLRFTAAKAELEVRDELIAVAVERSAGDLRQALSVMDALQLSGLDPARSDSLLVLKALVMRDVAAAIRAVGELLAEGESPRSVAEALFAQLRDVFYIRVGVKNLVSSPTPARYDAIANELSLGQTVAALDAVGDALALMTTNFDDQVALEMCLVSLCAEGNDNG